MVYATLSDSDDTGIVQLLSDIEDRILVKKSGDVSRVYAFGEINVIYIRRRAVISVRQVYNRNGIFFVLGNVVCMYIVIEHRQN